MFLAWIPSAACVLDFSDSSYTPDYVLSDDEHPHATGASIGMPLDFEGRHGKLWGNGQEFHVKGVNWYGSEARTGAPGGLNKHSVDWYMEQIAQRGFNAVRLLFNHQSVLSNEVIESADVGFSPQLFGMTYLEMFAEIADIAARKGILIMMACHRINPHAWPGDGLWYGAEVPESRVLESWDKIANALCGRWNVFAADLQNEPWAASWAKGHSTDWNKAAERIGNHVLSKCARWLIMVEGVGYTPGAPGLDGPGTGVWWYDPMDSNGSAITLCARCASWRMDAGWRSAAEHPRQPDSRDSLACMHARVCRGENLAGVKKEPIRLRDQTKVVYAPHTCTCAASASVEMPACSSTAHI